MINLPWWVIVLILIGTFTTGALVAWNNPKKKLLVLIDDEIDKALQGGNTVLKNALTTIKAKL